METCSRDVYDENQTISPIAAFAMLNGLLSVLVKLHSKGICHGDFYGHNILVSPDENKPIKLSDFGAAFFYDKSKEYGKWIEQIELRAFGVLVEEVARLVKFEDTSVQNLMLLAKLCAATSNFASLQEQWMALQTETE